MTTEELTTKVEAADDPAKELGTTETWSGDEVYVLRNAKGHFVTWRKVSPAEAESAPVAVADGGQEEITFTTERGADVTVTAENGTLFVSVDSSAITIDRTSAFVEAYKGMDVLNLGTHRVQGDRQKLQIPVGENKDEIEQLREDSEPEPTDEPLAYEVTETTRKGSWGQEITKQKLRATKPHGEMTEKEKELNMKVNKKNDVPNDAEAGDIVALEDILGDTRTREEKDQDALEEASETGEEVVISKTTTDCNDPSKECNLDHVTRVATPDGEIETRRTHTY